MAHGTFHYHHVIWVKVLLTHVTFLNFTNFHSSWPFILLNLHFSPSLSPHSTHIQDCSNLSQFLYVVDDLSHRHGF